MKKAESTTLANESTQPIFTKGNMVGMVVRHKNKPIDKYSIRKVVWMFSKDKHHYALCDICTDGFTRKPMAAEDMLLKLNTEYTICHPSELNIGMFVTAIFTPEKSKQQNGEI
jgi:hypothetical protein